MVLVPLLFPFRGIDLTPSVHESLTLDVALKLIPGLPTEASGITSVHGNSGIGPGVPLPIQTLVLSTDLNRSLFSGGVINLQPKEPMEITSAPLNNVALNTTKVSLYA